MREIDFQITGEYIELIKLLKAAHITVSGAEAKHLVEGGTITRNGEVELRKRAKIKAHESIIIDGVATIKTL